MIGIPYASHARKKDGTVDPSSVICPDCNEVISLKNKKDDDSFSRKNYAVHWEQYHQIVKQ